MDEKLIILAQELYEAKRNEDRAKATRIELEEQLAELIESPEEGSKTVKVGGDYGFKVTVRRGYSYKADVEAMEAELGKLAPLKTKVELDEKAYKALAEDNPILHRRAQAYVVATPRKVGVTVAPA